MRYVQVEKILVDRDGDFSKQQREKKCEVTEESARVSVLAGSLILA